MAAVHAHDKPGTKKGGGGGGRSFLLDKYNGNKARELERQILEHVHNQEILEDGTSIPSPHVSDITKHSMKLPSFVLQAVEKERDMMQILVDGSIQQNMTDNSVLNWCVGVVPLYPVKTKGDGNCLLHAASIAMWGIHDHLLTLRQLLHVAMTSDRGELQARWRKAQMQQQGHLMLQSMDMRQDWQHMVTLASTRKSLMANSLPYQSLEDIHIFVLAQLLRRPIVVLSESWLRNVRGSVMAPNHAPGVYLPLLWPAERCVRSPLVLSYATNHFCPLAAKASDVDREGVVRAVLLQDSRAAPLSVHYMTDAEEKRVNEKLQTYLDLVEIPVSVVGGERQTLLAARFTPDPLPQHLDLMPDFVEKFEVSWHKRSECQATAPPPAATSSMLAAAAAAAAAAGHSEHGTTAPKTCITPGCKYFGSEDFIGMCSGCHKTLSKSSSRKCSIRNCVNAESSTAQPYCNYHSYMKESSSSSSSLSSTPPAKAHSDVLTAMPRGITDPGARTGSSPTGGRPHHSSPAVTPPPPRSSTAPLVVPPGFSATVSALCRIPGCHLKSRAEFGHLCTQHYALQQAKELAEKVKIIAEDTEVAENVKIAENTKTADSARPVADAPIAPCLPKCTRCKSSNGVSHLEGMCGSCYTQVTNARYKAASEAKKDVPTTAAVCVADGCLEDGIAGKRGYCLDCYSKTLDVLLEANAKDEKEMKEAGSGSAEDETEEKTRYGTSQAQTTLPAAATSQAQTTLPAATTSQAQTTLPAATTSQAQTTLPAATTSQAQTTLPAAATSQAQTTLPAAATSQAQTTLPAAAATSQAQTTESAQSKACQSKQLNDEHARQAASGEQPSQDEPTTTTAAATAEGENTASMDADMMLLDENPPDVDPFKEEESLNKLEDNNSSSSSSSSDYGVQSISLASEPESEVIVSIGHSLPDDAKKSTISKRTSTAGLSSSNVNDVAGIVKCAYDTCNNRVVDPDIKLCAECHAILKRYKEKRKANPKQHRCASGCGALGDGQQQGYCTDCYRCQLSDPASHVHRSSPASSSSSSSFSISIPPSTRPPKKISINMRGGGMVVIGGERAAEASGAASGGEGAHVRHTSSGGGRTRSPGPKVHVTTKS